MLNSESMDDNSLSFITEYFVYVTFDLSLPAFFFFSMDTMALQALQEPGKPPSCRI